MLIDTHCHVFLPQFTDDIDAVLQHAADAGVKHIFMPAINPDSLEQMNPLSHPDIEFHKMAGLHPTEINEGKGITEQELYDICSRDEIAGIGETGLDYYWSDEYKTQQRESLHMHCRIAKKVAKPVILHNRASTDDLLTVVEEEQDGSLTGIWHCFNGSADEGRRAIDLGLHLGIGGMLTFKNADIDTAVARLPLEKMVLETDAPYLAPEPHRGKRNEPAFVKDTAKYLARMLDIPLEDLADQTSRTALKLFSV